MFSGGQSIPQHNKMSYRRRVFCTRPDAHVQVVQNASAPVGYQAAYGVTGSSSGTACFGPQFVGQQFDEYQAQRAAAVGQPLHLSSSASGAVHAPVGINSSGLIAGTNIGFQQQLQSSAESSSVQQQQQQQQQNSGVATTGYYHDVMGERTPSSMMMTSVPAAAAEDSDARATHLYRTQVCWSNPCRKTGRLTSARFLHSVC